MPGIHLNENGRAMVSRVADRLSRLPVKAIYSSPLERAMETAMLIAKPLEMKVEAKDGLIEIDCGKWQGQKFSRLSRSKLWKVVQLSPSRFCFPGGETFLEGQQRICNQIESICEQHGSKDILICVSHSDPIRLAVAHYIGMPLDFFQRLRIEPASITGLYIDRTETRLLFLNYEVSFRMIEA
jgi:probable phosphoglycerate mutase